MADRRAAALGLVLVLMAAAGAGVQLAALVPVARWGSLPWPDPARLAEVVATQSLLPRFAAALLAGAALGVSGGLLQQVLRNPLAAPDTVGVAAGAQLALVAATLAAPHWLQWPGRDAVAFAGAAAAVAVVLALAWRSRLAPATVLLCGLVVGLYAASLGGTLVLLFTHRLDGVFLWSAGTLEQLGWAVPERLGLRLAVAGAAVTLLRRPLRLLDLPDEMARGLGVAVPAVRLAGLVVAVGLGASVVALVGPIGFVGLGAPALARAAGSGRAGRGRAGLGACAAMGAGLLGVADGLVQLCADWTVSPLPTGAVTALAGAPLLLVLLLRSMPDIGMAAADADTGWRIPVPAGAALLLLVAAGALFGGNSPHGWAVDPAMLPVREPRVAGAAVAGALLAMAGLTLQRTLRNPIASPELLGVGTGTVLGLAATLWLGLDGAGTRLAAGAAGGAIVLALLVGLARGGSRPGRMLLAGIALGAAFQSVLTVLLASGDPRGETVLNWMSGSTYGVDARLAWAATTALVVLGGLAALLGRWLDLLPLGTELAQAVGLPANRARLLLLLLAGAATGTATLLVGPLSFVGLLAPHLVRGGPAARRLPAVALVGAVVMVAADWAGRTVLFPAEIPAGAVAALLGGPVLLLTLLRKAT